MEAVNGVSEGDKGGPPPPSPLTGCYLLIVIGEPHCNEHKDIILQRVAKGLLSWDLNDCLVDLEKELAIITEQALEGEEARYGERLIQFASENLVTEILIHPVVSTLAQCVRNLLSSFTRHRHIIHAGYTFANNGSWVLQDGTFSSTDFSEAFQEIEVLRVIRAYENGISLDLHCAPEGDWTRLPKEPFTKGCKVRVNSNDVLTAGSPSISSFINYLEPFLVPADLESVLESSDVVGNIRFSRPTLYVFPGGQGDAALFGINGFNMLLDGGFSRKACFWDFVRHLDRLDAVLLTRLNNSNVNGISAVLKRKKQNALYPQIGHFFCNIQERKAILSPDGDKDKDPLLVNLLDEGQDIVSNLRHLSLIPQVCYRDSEPINLYHKVGHGTLDMYVLSPAKDSKEVREFLQKWNNNDQKLFANQRTNKEFVFPLQNLVSICALLVWQPANPEDTITRILFPGSSPQNKIFEGLEKVKSLDFIKHPVCSEKSLAPTTIIKAKQSVIDKLMQPEKRILDNKKDKAQKPPPDTNDTEIKNGEVNGVQPTEKVAPVKKSDSTESEKSISKPKKIIENGEKIERSKPRPKPEPRTKPRSDSQQRKVKTAEKKPSPTTPKKQVDRLNDDSLKPKPKPSPTATPAKSAKDANNRKVVESKIKSAPPRKEPPKPAAEKKEVKVERKPISRRPKDVSKLSGSPSKKVNGIQKPDSISKRGKLDKEGTTDSSTVSTPSAEQDSILKKDISKLTSDEIQNLKAQELADLKEEQEAVKEIEAVFRKGELHEDKPSDFRKIKDLSIDDKLECEEYLIIEKTEIEQDLVNESNKEEETQKIARDSEESEKQRKLSEEKESVEEKRIEVQDEAQKIITSASDVVKVKEETVEASKEVSATSPEDKIDVSTDKKDIEEIKEIAQESQPDEKGSANIESGATTTAPTLPEDERMPLDEIKEDNGDQIEEKHVKEDTKEKDVPVIQLPPKTFENVTKLPPVVGIRLDKQSHIRDIVKTPDEVADLPVHEEVEFDHYDEYPSATETKSEPEEVKKEDAKEKVEDKIEEAKQDAVVEKEVKTGKEEETKESVDKEKTDVGIKKEEIESEAKNNTEQKSPKETADQEVKTVISEDLNKKELSKSPDEEKDTDEHELEQKKEETKDIKLASQEKVVKEDKKDETNEKSQEEAKEDKKDEPKEKPQEEVEIIPDEKTTVKESVAPEIKETKESEVEGKEVDEHKEQADKTEELTTKDQPKVEEVIEKSETEVKEKDDLKEKIPEHKQIDEKEKLDELSEKFPEVPKHEITSEPADQQKLKEDVTTIQKIDEKLQKLKDEREEVVVTEVEKEKEEEAIVPKKEETELKEDVTSIEKLDEKLQKLKEEIEEEHIKAVSEVVTHKTEEPQHAEPVIITTDSQPDSPDTERRFDDKLELGRKSPKEREEDVALIVASVAEVLKSDAPLEEFEGKIPFSIPYKSYTTELRETHITTVESPITDEEKIVKAIEESMCPKTSSSYLIEEERRIAPIHEEPEIAESKISKMIKDSNDLMQATSRMIHDIKQTQPKTDTIVEEPGKEEQDSDNGTVHRMLVTASSEDGGEEIEICPAGTITFSRSSESSGRSSPDPQSQKLSQKSSIADTFSDATVITKSAAKDLQAEPSKTVEDSTKDEKDDKDLQSVIEKAVCDNKNLVNDIDNVAKEIVDQIEVDAIDQSKIVKEFTEKVEKDETKRGDTDQKDHAPEVSKDDPALDKDDQKDAVENDIGEICKNEETTVESPKKVDIEKIETPTDTSKIDVHAKSESKVVSKIEEPTLTTTESDKDATPPKEETKDIAEEAISTEIKKDETKDETKTQKEDTKKISTDEPKEPETTKEISEIKQESTKDEIVESKIFENEMKSVDEKDSKIEADIKKIVSEEKGAGAVDFPPVEEKAGAAIPIVEQDVKQETHTVEEAIQQVKDASQRKIETIAKEVKEEKSFLGGLVNDIGASLLHDTTKLIEEAQQQVHDLQESAKSKIEGLKEEITTKKEVIESAVQDLKQSSSAAVTETKEAVKTEAQKLSEPAESSKSKVEEVQESIVKEKESVVEATKEAFESNKSVFKEIKESAAKEKEKLVEKVQDLEKSVVSEAEAVTEKVKSEIASTKETVEDKIKNVEEVIATQKEIVSDVITDIKDAVVQDVETKVQEIKEEVEIAKESAVTKVEEVCKLTTEKISEEIADLKKDVDTAADKTKEVVHESKTELEEAKDKVREDAAAEIKEIQRKADAALKDLTEKEESIIKSVADETKHVEKKFEEKKEQVAEKLESLDKDLTKAESTLKETVESTLTEISSVKKDIVENIKGDAKSEEVLEHKYDLYNGLESVEKMVVDVLTADREEAVSKTDDKKLEEKQKESDSENIVDKGVSEIKEFVEETKEAITSLFKGDSDKEKVLEKSAHNIEENFEIVSDMAKSVVFEKCDKASDEHEKQEKRLEKSAKSLEEDFEIVTDMAKSIVFDKCEKPLTEEKRDERVLERSAQDIEENFNIVSEMVESVVFDKCEKPLEEEEKKEKILETLGKDLEDNFKTVTDMAQSAVFEKCEKEEKEPNETGQVKTAQTEGKAEGEKDSKVSAASIEIADSITSVLKDDIIESSLKSGKESPEKLETKEDLACKLSGKSSPALSSELRDLGKEGSGKSTPDLKETDHIKVDNQDSLLSGKSSPGLSGKSSPILSGISSPGAKAESKDSLLSGKSTPDHTKPDSKESGKSSPALSAELKSDEKEKLQVEVKEESARSSPAGSGKTSPAPSSQKTDALSKELIDSPLKVSPAGSGKTSPAPPIDKPEKAEEKDASVKGSRSESGKASPAPSDDLKKDKIEIFSTEAKDASAKSSPAASGKASPAPPKDSKEEKTDVLSTEGKDASVKGSSADSGKASPAPPSDLKPEKAEVLSTEGKDVSVKESPAASGKASPVESGKTSPAPAADFKQQEKPEVLSAEAKDVSAKSSPAGSGKTSPAPSADVKQDSKAASAKASPDVSGKASPAPSGDLKLEKPEDGNNASVKPSPDASGKTSPTPESLEAKNASTKSSPAGSGKASPALILDVKTTEEAKSESIKDGDVKKVEEKYAKPVVDEKTEQKDEVTKKDDAKSEKDVSAKAPDIPADTNVASPEKKTEKVSEAERKTSLDVQQTKEKKLSISDVQISMKSEEKGTEKSTSDLSKSESPEDTKILDDKTETKELDSIDSGIGTEVESKIKKSEEVEKIEVKSDESSVKSTQKKEESIAGPSVTLPDTSLSPARTSSEDLHLSGKSTPDIAEVEKLKEMQEKREKHIPGSSTPPTVPVSPIVKDLSSTQPEDAKASSSTPVKSSVISLKDNDLRSCTPGSDDYEIGASTHSDISSGQVSRAPHLLESERVESDDDDDVPGSPMSVTSQVAHSRSSSRYDFEDDRIGTKMDPMNTSFYGALPDEEDTELDFEKALAEHRQTRGEDLVAAEESPSYLYEVTKAKYSAKTPEPEPVTGQTQLDQINKNGASNVMTASFMGELPTSTTKDTKDVLDSWGKPLGLPSPAPPNDNRGTPKKERKLPSNVSAKNKLNEKRAESPSKYKNKKLSPVYVDLTYVPHHGNSYYSYVDFFKRVRARYYVFSGIEPSREVYNALLEAKQTWEDKELEVTIIPTYDTDILGYWVAENEELLTKYKIDLSPSASRCTINLQDHETSCSAYRLEF